MMNLKKKLSSIPNWFTAPLALALLTVLAYGLSLWRLGFYWDDLPISWIRYELGSASTVKYFSDSRPIWGLIYQLTGSILPHKPVYWQAFAMLWRWAVSAMLWLVILTLFPKRKTLAFFLALMVLLYPGFNQQWVSFLYTHFFIVIFSLFFSWYLTLRGRTIPALLFAALNLFTLEYFFTLEFIRPFLIFKSLMDQPLTTRERIVKSFKTWLPYLGVVFVVVLYKALVFSHPGFGYSLKDELIHAPLATLTDLMQRVFSSLWLTVVGAWAQSFQFPSPAVNGIRTSVLYVIVVLVVGVVGFFFKQVDEETPSNKNDALWLIVFGVIMLGLGGVPFWVTNLPVTLGFPANRATLSFMLGACFFLMGLLDILPARFKYSIAIVLVSLAAGRQFLWSVDYARDWNSQKNMFWQMTWRAPSLQKGTVVLINEELSFYADNSLGAALNWVYAPDSNGDVMDYALFYPTNRDELSLQPNTPVDYDFLAGKFHGNTSQAVVFYYAPPKCLRLLDPEIDSNNRLIPDDTLLRDAALLSSTRPVSDESIAVMPEVYGPEPAHGWCYYFEQADLARQMGEWEEVARLGDIAFKLDDYPNDPIERFVFIEGYAHVGNWEKAVELSKLSYKVSKNYVREPLCILWSRIEREIEKTSAQNVTFNEVQTEFECLP